MGCELYNKYVEPVGRLLHGSECLHHGYADDNTIWQIVSPNVPTNLVAGMQSLERTIDKTRAWMLANKLGLNDGKIEFIVFVKHDISKKCNSVF